MEQDRRYVNVYLDKATLEQIDEYRFANRLVSRTEAIRRLIDIGLDHDARSKGASPRPASRKP